MIHDRLQYLFYDFWNDKNATKSGTSDTVFITKILSEIQENYGGGILEHIIFRSENRQFRKFGKADVPNCLNVCNLFVF